MTSEQGSERLQEGELELVAALAPAPKRPQHDWERTKNILISVICAVLLLAGLALVAQRLSKILLIVVVAALIAYIAEPAVSRLRRAMLRLPAALLVYAAFLAILVGAGACLTRQLIPQASALAQDFPADVARPQGWIAYLEMRMGQPGLISGQLGSLESGLKSAAGTSLGTGLGFVGRAGDAVASIVLTLVISLYFALDASSIWKAVRELVPAGQVYRFDFVEKQLNRIIGGYIRGQLLEAPPAWAFVIVSAVVKQLRGEPVEGLIEPPKRWPKARWGRTASGSPRPPSAASVANEVSSASARPGSVEWPA